MIICFTGFRNKEWEKLIELNGGKIGSTVNSKTTLLVVNTDDNTSKIVNARKLGVKIMSKETFENEYINKLN